MGQYSLLALQLWIKPTSCKFGSRTMVFLCYLNEELFLIYRVLGAYFARFVILLLPSCSCCYYLFIIYHALLISLVMQMAVKSVSEMNSHYWVGH